MVKLTYRRASVEDLPLLYRLAREIWIPAFAPLFTNDQLEALYRGMYNDEILTEWLSTEGNELYFIYQDDRAIGYTAIEKHEGFLKLDKIYIHQDLQGGGLGSEAMGFIEGLAADSGLKEIRLRVNRGNDLAIKFYRKRGYEVVDSIDFPGPDGYRYEDYWMSKILSGDRS
jgi:ribosomal protein S18 acetylase RimI-like enzyme